MSDGRRCDRRPDVSEISRKLAFASSRVLDVKSGHSSRWHGPRYAGHRVELHPFQKEALDRLTNPIHLLCIAPTGSGKSLIYERIAAQPGKRTLLISPLVALARQQARTLSDLGIPVVLHCGNHPKPPAPVGSGAWIISPESLHSEFTLSSIRRWKPDFLVVDECHCLFDWGERFRTAFLKIPSLIHSLGINTSLWLTATLPPDAKSDLETRLGVPLSTLGEFALPPNLQLEVLHLPWIHRTEFLLERISRADEAGIIFVTTREATRRVQNLLRFVGRPALVYHAGLSFEERIAVENSFRQSENGILIATSAFGMGMNYLNLRWSILWQPPFSLLALAQALGRIGRNREQRASASLFWDEEDFRSLLWLASDSERQRRALQEMHAYLISSSCRIRSLESRFSGENRKSASFVPCRSCDFCLSAGFSP